MDPAEHHKALVPLGPETAKYLDDKAAESFKRQVDLEESIWRSLPLFTGALIAAAALLAKIASSLPPVHPTTFPIISYALLVVTTFLFGVAFWWLWQVVKPRDYDFPASDEAVVVYTKELNEFHFGQGVEGPDLDRAVIGDLRSYMTDSLGKAARSTFDHNQARLSARSQVLIWLICGFMLSFLSGAIIYGHNLFFPEQEIATAEHEKTSEPSNTASSGNGASFAPARATTTVSSIYASSEGRRMADKDKHSRPNQGQMNEQRGQTSKSGTHSVRSPSAGQAGSSTNAAAN